MSRKPIIAVDCDDVLAQFAESFIEYSNKNYDCELTVEDYDEWWGGLWGVDMDMVVCRAKKIFQDPEFYPKFLPIDGSQEVIRRLVSKYNVVVLTSRRLELSETTNIWLKQHFPEVSELFFSGNYDNLNHESAHRTKGDACLQIGADYLIDDQPKHTNAAAEYGIKSLLFGDYGWNRDAEIIDGVTRVTDWTGVADYFGV